MSHNAAGEDKLGLLHNMVAEVLMEELKASGDDEPIDPRILSSAISFLRDNKIKADPFLSEKMSEIEERVKARKKRFSIVPSEAAQRAANE